MKTYYQAKCSGPQASEAMKFLQEIINLSFEKDPEFSEKYSFIVTDENIEFIKIAWPENALVYTRSGE